MAKYTYDQFLKVIRARTYAPVVLFHGAEDLLIDEAIDAIVDQTLDSGTRSFNLDVVWGSKADAREVIAHASSFPMMSDKRVVVVREFDRLVSTDAANAAVSAYLDKPLASTILLLAVEKPDRRKKAFKDIGNHADVVECTPLEVERLPAWLEARFKQGKKTIEPDACQLLVAHTGTSLRALQNEVQKVLIAAGDRSIIRLEDIAAVVGTTRGYTVFDLQNAIGRRDLAGALPILRRMLELGESHVLIIIMLTRYFMTIMRLKELIERGASESAILSAVHVPSTYVKAYVTGARQFSAAEIDRAFGALLLADVQLKTSALDVKVAMELLVHALINGSPEVARIAGPA